MTNEFALGRKNGKSQAAWRLFCVLKMEECMEKIADPNTHPAVKQACEEFVKELEAELGEGERNG